MNLVSRVVPCNGLRLFLWRADAVRSHRYRLRPTADNPPTQSGNYAAGFLTTDPAIPREYVLSPTDDGADNRTTTTATGEDDCAGGGYSSLDYQSLCTHLWAAVQQLHGRVVQLEAATGLAEFPANT